MRNIAIIGGGASGTLLAINLLRAANPSQISIALVEKRETVGRGIAYSTAFEHHLLNVPAAKMSAFPDEPEHFLNWLGQSGHSFGPSDFVPRRIYGDYLSSLLDSEARLSASLVRVFDEATDLEQNDGGIIVKLASGKEIPADLVVLAFGNFLPPHPSVPDLSFITAEKYIRDVWSAGSLEKIEPSDEVLVIGTGLSMVDFVLNLRSAGHQGKIQAISTKGLLPAEHKLGYTYPAFADELKGVEKITQIFTAVRKHTAVADANGSDWRAVIDSLRPVKQELWQQLPTAEKRYFMQHLSRYWNAARHRMPPAAAETIREMRTDGQLEVLSGRLRHISTDTKGRFLVNFSRNGLQDYINCDVLVNCIASQSNFARIESELVKNLLGRGTIRCDAVNLGLDATPDGRLVDVNGIVSDKLRTLGTALKGTLWETTAVPEIRVQASKLAETIAKSDG